MWRSHSVFTFFLLSLENLPLRNLLLCFLPSLFKCCVSLSPSLITWSKLECPHTLSLSNLYRTYYHLIFSKLHLFIVYFASLECELQLVECFVCFIYCFFSLEQRLAHKSYSISICRNNNLTQQSGGNQQGLLIAYETNTKPICWLKQSRNREYVWFVWLKRWCLPLCVLGKGYNTLRGHVVGGSSSLGEMVRIKPQRAYSESKEIK